MEIRGAFYGDERVVGIDYDWEVCGYGLTDVDQETDYLRVFEHILIIRDLKIMMPCVDVSDP